MCIRDRAQPYPSKRAAKRAIRAFLVNGYCRHKGKHISQRWELAGLFSEHTVSEFEKELEMKRRLQDQKAFRKRMHHSYHLAQEVNLDDGDNDLVTTNEVKVHEMQDVRSTIGEITSRLAAASEGESPAYRRFPKLLKVVTFNVCSIA